MKCSGCGVYYNGPHYCRPTDPLPHGDAIQKAVDDWLLMERKARAWDELRAFSERAGFIGMVAHMDSFVHPPQDPSK